MTGPLWTTLPRTWQHGQVKHLADVTLGKMLQGSDSGNDTLAPYLRAANIQPDGALDVTSVKEMWFSTSELSALDIRAGDALVVEGGQGGYGRAAFVREALAGFGFQNSVNRLRPHENGDGRYLAYYLIALRASGFIQAYCNVVSMPHLTSEKLAALPMPLPPLQEQCAIADYLDRETAQIDTLIAEQQRLIDLVNERRAAEIELNLGSSDGYVPLKRLLQRIDQGISPDTSLGKDDARYWVVKAGCTNAGVFRPQESKPVPDGEVVPDPLVIRPGDLLVSRASGSIELLGSAALATASTKTLILSDKTYRLVPSEGVSPDFLYWNLNSRRYREHVRSYVGGASGLANNLSLTNLLGFPIPNAPAARGQEIADDLQRSISRFDALISEAERLIDLARERRTALITAAVTGQIDIRKAAS